MSSNYNRTIFIKNTLFFIHTVAHVQYSNCTTGDIRLTDGTTEYEGRVEVCINGVWGVICDYGWDTREAYAVCHQLGYQGNNFKGLSLLTCTLYACII